MKKLALISAGLFIVAIALSSCKKDYTCECTVGGVSVKYTIEKTTKADAETKCNTYITGTTVCELQ
ncbi:MAG TPA: hypothetical protein PKW80_16135 [Bacteroidales bacterium]|nr:hypothetical protein [Bacteroidales bacterium]